jgi:cytochrome c-type biogenesis protein CcmH
MRGKWIITLTLAAGLCIATYAKALVTEPPLENPAQEQAAQGLFHELRCVVCAGESLAESNAALAVQMRAEIRRRIGAGESAAAIRTYFNTQYGDTILLRPPLDARTLPLWLAPLLFLALGAYLILRRWR